MVSIDWIGLVLLSLSNPNSNDELISVGSDFNCHYQPDQLYEAMQKHEKLYLSNDFVIQSLKVNNTQVHLVGGFDDCSDIKHGVLSQQRSIISGNNESAALEIDTKANQSVIVENFEVIDGHGKDAGGIAVLNTQSFTVINSLIYQNVALGSGGGIHLIGDGAEVHIRGSQIHHNHAMQEGGGIAISGQNNAVDLSDSVVYSNQADMVGGGVSCLNHNRISMSSSTHDIQSVTKNNQAPMGKDLYYELTCQFYWRIEQVKSMLKS